MSAMRLFKRGEFWYVEFPGGARRSTKATNERDARAVFRELKREYLKGRLTKLEPGRRVTLAEFMERYLERQYSSIHTQKVDSLSLRLLADVVGAGTSLRGITAGRIDEFKAACLARGCNHISVNTYLRQIKAALGVAEDWYEGYQRPKIKLLKVARRLARVLSPEQIKQLLDTARETDPDFHPMLMVYLWTGIRRAELLSLRWENISLEDGSARVIGKGNKERVVPILPELAKLLEPLRKDIGAVFQVSHPDILTHKFVDLARACKIKARLHDLRHAAATYMLASGTPINVVQAVLGHASVTTTQIYAKTLAEMVKRETRLSYE